MRSSYRYGLKVSPCMVLQLIGLEEVIVKWIPLKEVDDLEYKVFINGVEFVG